MVKTFQIDGLGTVRFYKRRTSKNLRLRLDTNGEVKVSMPYWAPYRAALNFVLSKRQWISQQQFVSQPLSHGMRVGKSHRLKFAACPVAKVKTRLVGNEVLVDHPTHLNPHDSDVQLAARRAATKALKIEAEKLLETRLRQLATNHNLVFNRLRYRHLKSRWGSCSSQADLTLNICLMHLPWELIDYVLLHELTHTKVMSHGPKFWKQLAQYLPDYEQRRRRIRVHKPVLAVAVA